MKIAICDDEKYFRESLTDYIGVYAKNNDLIITIDVYKSAKELLAKGIDLIQYTAIFLDINMDEIDGIMAAKQIRKMNKEVSIVFVTAFVNYMIEGYKVNAIRYVLKDIKNMQKSIDECMDAIIDNINYRHVKKSFKFNDGITEISIDRILYIESNLHKLTFHIIDEGVKAKTMYDTLDSVENALKDNHFIRIHQSFLVNLSYLKKITRYTAELQNKQQLSISKSRYTTVKNEFIAYQGEL